MIITHKISMDLIRHGVSPRISVVQGDENSRAVEVYLTANGCAWKVPGGAACVVRYKKPDGHGGVYSTMPDGTSAYSVNGNTVTVMLVPQVINVPGLVELSVAIAEGKSVAGTFSFYVNVERDPSAGLTDSADYFSFSSLEEINTALISLFAKTEIDASLKKSGLPADAAAVGAAVSQLSAEKAPAGYGLGTQNQSKVTTLKQLDNMGHSGWYDVQLSTEKIKNYIKGTLCINAGYHVIEQVFAPWTQNFKLIRYWDYEYGWSEWAYDSPPMLLGEEYRTTERYMGKAVYTLLVDLGTLPVSENKYVYPSIPNNATIVSIAGIATDGKYSYPFPLANANGVRGVIFTAFDANNQFYACVRANQDCSALTAKVEIKYIKD